MSTPQTARSKPIIYGLIDTPGEQIILVGRSLHKHARRLGNLPLPLKGRLSGLPGCAGPRDCSSIAEASPEEVHQVRVGANVDATT